MINALHPIDKKEGEEEPHIRNQEAWKRYLRGLVFAIYDNPEHKEQSKLLETYSYAFTYPDSTNITLEMTRNNSETNLLSTDGVKNQAVIMKSTLIFRLFCFEPSSLSVARLILFHENDGLRFNCITMMTLLFDSFLRLIQSHQIINPNTLKILQVLQFDQEILLLFLIPL